MMIDPSFFHDTLFGYVLKRVKDRSVAKDIVQDVYMKFHCNAGNVKDQTKVFAWIYRVAQNVITDHFRMTGRKIDADDIDWDSASSDLNQCVERCISEKLSTLPIKYREALELSELQGQSQLELAERLNLSYSGFKSRVQRARQMLKERLERDYNVKIDSYGNVLRCENRIPCNC